MARTVELNLNKDYLFCKSNLIHLGRSTTLYNIVACQVVCLVLFSPYPFPIINSFFL